jgi:hypothetical protein
MSYDEQAVSNAGQLNQDRIIQLLSESRERPDFLFRTLFGNKYLPQVVYQLEHLKIHYPHVSTSRKKTLENFHELHKNTLISTVSIDGKMLDLVTQTRIKHTQQEQKPEKKNMFGDQ